jgi:hypothetical protein
MKSTTELVEETADLFQRRLDDEAVVSQLMADGAAQSTAWKLVTFLPMAFVRLMLADKGPRFSAEFQVTGETKPRSLADEPVFVEATRFGQRPAIRAKGGEYWMIIAGRGAEFDAINRLMNNGSRLENISLGMPAVALPPES